MKTNFGFRQLEQTIGISIKIVSNEYREMPTTGDINNSYQEIVFQIHEEDPDIYAIGVLFSLSLISFTYAAPRGSSHIEFVLDEDWRIEYFLAGKSHNSKPALLQGKIWAEYPQSLLNNVNWS